MGSDFKTTWMASLAMLGMLAAPANAQGSAGDSPGTTAAATELNYHNLLYCWDTSIPGSKKKTKTLIQDCKDRGITAVGIEASPVGYGLDGAVKDYTKFAKRLHDDGLLCVALIGYSWFTVSPDAGLPGQPTSQEEGFFVVQNVAGSNIFDALLDDSQPYLNTYFEDGVAKNYLWDDTDAALFDFMNWMDGVREHAGNLPIVKSTPFWFDSDPRLTELLLAGSETPHDLAWYVASKSDIVNVLTYRDVALGPGGIIEFVLTEMSYGPVLVGVETNDLGSTLEYLTFAEEGWYALVTELYDVFGTFTDVPNFFGFYIHDYAGMLALPQ